ncbi:Peroxisome chaperone and import receptor [Microbotryomycetes sp. JL201]|nr:Peroxisome chaperone and import receptor [Microbotryomycetes sp. JL201]
MTDTLLLRFAISLDDLDDVLDEFNNPSSTTPSAARSAPSAGAPSSSTTTNARAAAAAESTTGDDDFPDPDDDALDAPGLDDQLVQELTKGMQSLFSGLGRGDGASTGGPAGDEDLAGLASLDNEEWRKLMNEFIKEEVQAGKTGAGATGADKGSVAGGKNDDDGKSEEETMLEMLKILQMGSSQQNQGSKAATNAAATADKGKARATNANKPAPSFSDTVAATLSKMKETSSTVDAETEAKNAASSDPLTALMAQMAAGGDDFGGEEGLQSMLDEMMGQLMSRDVLYEPLKELRDKYPEYLQDNESKLPAEDIKRYKQQQAIVNDIIAKFEEREPTDADGKAERQNEITELVAKMNDCGAPPKEIMGEMPADLELGPDGMPKMPGDCPVS